MTIHGRKITDEDMSSIAKEPPVFVVIDSKDGDLFTEEYCTEDDAIEAAEAAWDKLTDAEKASREAFYVIKSVNPDPDAQDHLDGDIVKEWK